MIVLADALSGYMKGNQEAVELILALHQVAEMWDDLIDKDKPATDEQINAAMYAALIQIPRNSFYQRHFARLNPLVESSILDWITATRLERSKDSQKLHTAYGLRFSTFALTSVAANIIGGFEWGQKVNDDMRSMAEPWADYAAEHGVAENGMD